MVRKLPPLDISKSLYDAVIFDLDGVVTKTAKVHAAAWKRVFDAYLEERTAADGKDYPPFDLDRDYRRYVDGKPRYEGAQSFLSSRAIELPFGSKDDPPDRETVCGLGNKKNDFFHHELQHRGVEVYPATLQLIRRLRSKRYKTAVVSSSKNCTAVLQAARIEDLFDAKVDGVDVEALDIPGKPAPDIFLEAARRLGVHPKRAAVVEDAIAGVQAAKQGRFGSVVGVDRKNQPRTLQEHGANIVVDDLSTLAIEGELLNAKTSVQAFASALDRLEEIKKRAEGKRLAVFLDYDGTLTPIVERPEQAILSNAMRKTVSRLAEQCFVAVISGRDLGDVRSCVGIDTIFYAGSHGFDIAGPHDRSMDFQQGNDFLPALDRATEALEERLGGVGGVLVERKKFSLAVHYRNVRDPDVGRVETAVDQVLADHDKLRKSSGKKIFELQPRMDWNKGKAVLWLLKRLDMDRPEVLPLYLGDDVTDEDAFDALRDRGIGIVVEKKARATAAQYALEDPDEVDRFLNALSAIIEGEKS